MTIFGCLVADSSGSGNCFASSIVGRCTSCGRAETSMTGLVASSLLAGARLLSIRESVCAFSSVSTVALLGFRSGLRAGLFGSGSFVGACS